jgi:hypothetical protein
MKPSGQRLSEVSRQRTEAVVSRHMHELFKRLPTLSGFWLRPDLEVAELSVFTWQGYTAGADLYEAVTQSLVDLTRGATRGRATYARAHLCVHGALSRPQDLYSVHCPNSDALEALGGVARRHSHVRATATKYGMPTQCLSHQGRGGNLRRQVNRR